MPKEDTEGAEHAVINRTAFRDWVDTLSPAAARRVIAEWEADVAAAASPGEKDLRLAVAVAETAADMLDRWLKGHPPGCGCPCCGRRDIANLLYDVAGLEYATARATNVLTCTLSSPVRLDGESFGDDLRALAVLSDELDAAERGDEPAAVTAEGGDR